MPSRILDASARLYTSNNQKQLANQLVIIEFTRLFLNRLNEQNQFLTSLTSPTQLRLSITANHNHNLLYRQRITDAEFHSSPHWIDTEVQTTELIKQICLREEPLISW